MAVFPCVPHLTMIYGCICIGHRDKAGRKGHYLLFSALPETAARGLTAPRGYMTQEDVESPGLHRDGCGCAYTAHALGMGRKQGKRICFFSSGLQARNSAGAPRPGPARIPQEAFVLLYIEKSGEWESAVAPSFRLLGSCRCFLP